MSTFTDDQKVYTTPHGTQLHGDSLRLLQCLGDESVDLIVTSPPFALQRKKAYGNEDQEVYVKWLAQFGEAAKRVLKPSGSLVVDIGNAYRKGSPTRSLYPYRVLLEFVDELKYHLAEEFFWYNPAKLPSPLEWVNKRRIRVKDAVNTVWWFSKTEWPQADVNQVLLPYSKNMERLLKDPEKYYKTTLRPSEHSISKHFGNDNGGSIPSNLLQVSNTESNSNYLRLCRALDIKSHPARFPTELPRFFIEFLTKPGDVVVDIFSGSNTTGMVAEQLGRKWYSFELSQDYAALSIMRFLPGVSPQDAQVLYEKARAGRVSLPQDGQALAAAAAQSAVTEASLSVESAQAALDAAEAEFRRAGVDLAEAKFAAEWDPDATLDANAEKAVAAALERAQTRADGAAAARRDAKRQLNKARRLADQARSPLTEFEAFYKTNFTPEDATAE
ncbi:site-specific DNA-methyltransferase [Streptomyces anulatus]|uniref:DNA-methyltransferase n=1 Tax=Streptomyces anulatus TaxID=1892 RepID=UPI002E30BB78|nr:site-specific DNA-methyltransferase [Streptomyces anulatus]